MFININVIIPICFMVDSLNIKKDFSVGSEKKKLDQDSSNMIQLSGAPVSTCRCTGDCDHQHFPYIP